MNTKLVRRRKPVRLLISWVVLLSLLATQMVLVKAWPVAAEEITAVLISEQTVYVNGTITSDTVWTAAESPYVVDGILKVAEGATLTIEPGVVVKFDAGSCLVITGLWPGGAQLLAQGTEDNKIYFTSLKDDTIGGDTNGDGNATAPGPGDWSYIYVQHGGQATLDWAEVRYGGVGAPSGHGALWVDDSDSALTVNHSTVSDADYFGIEVVEGATASISNSTVRDNGNNGIYVSDSTLDAKDNVISDNGRDGIRAFGVATISGNIISSNLGDGIDVTPTNAWNIAITDNTITGNTHGAVLVSYNIRAGLPLLSGNTLSSNGYNALGLGGLLRENMTLPVDPGMPGYVIPSLQVENATLTIEPGVVLKFDTGSLKLYGGQLLAQGMEGNEIHFTSLKDDSVGGDTNGDGDATTPGADDYHQILIAGGAQAILDHTVVRHGGHSGYPSFANVEVYGSSSLLTLRNSILSNASCCSALRVRDGASASVTNTIFQDNAGAGIAVYNAANLDMTTCTISNNSGGGIEVSDATMSVGESAILSNGDIGVQVQAGNVTITGSCIAWHTEFGVQNTTSSPIVQAVGNEWGHPFGPYHPDTNPDGRGNAVSDYVAYDPWSVSLGICPSMLPTAEDDFYSTDEGTTLAVDAPGVLGNDYDADGDALTANLLTNPSNGTLGLQGDGSFTYMPEENFSGTDNFTYEACDPSGLCDEATVIITVNPGNDPPTADPNGPYSGIEGSPVAYDGTGSSDPDGDSLDYAWDFGDGSTGTGATPTHTYADNSSYVVCLTVTDTGELADTQCTTAEIANVDPGVEPITVDQTLLPVDTQISASAVFTDPGILDTHTAVWGWGDGSTSPGTVNETNGSGTASGSHTYSSPGVYTVELTVTDKDGGIGKARFQYVVAYDSEGGFVTGGGWIDSPEGAYAPDRLLTGKATFGFVSKYKKGADAPTGQTEFQFHVADLNFHSSSYDWLVVAGAKAMYKGVGTINGGGDYGFMLSAIDADINENDSFGIDRFRIKIWDRLDDEVVYDNQICQDTSEEADPCTEIGGGSIVIHSKK